MNHIRNSAKAIIIKDGKLLCTKNEDQTGIFYLLPGGGQEKGETLKEALKRECIEEISAEVEVEDIIFIREYIGKNHEFSKWDYELHQVEYMFKCVIISEKNIETGTVPDDMQIGVEWLELDKLREYRLYPSALKDLISEKGEFGEVVYLGDTN